MIAPREKVHFRNCLKLRKGDALVTAEVSGQLIGKGSGWSLFFYTQA